MPSIFPLQTSFAAGELSPRLRGRVDAPVYKQGLATCDNWNPTPQGSLLKRNGLGIVTRALGLTRTIQFKSAALERYQVALFDSKLKVFTPAGLFGAFSAERVVNGECNNGAGGWTFPTSDSTYVGTAPDQYLAFANFGSAEARQSIAAVPAGTYNFNFRVRGHHDSFGPISVKVGTTLGGSQLLGPTTAHYVGAYSALVTVAAPTTVYISFSLAPTATGQSAGVDDVSLRDTTTLSEVAAPWTADEIPEVQYAAETGRDRIIFVHPNHEPRVLQRAPTGVWSLSLISTVGWTVPKAAPLHTVDEWSAGNYPGVIDIWQGRVWMAATPLKKNTFWASRPFSYDFTAVDYSALNAGDGFSYDAAMKGEIRWLQGQKVMLCGGDEGEYSISANDGVVYAGNLDIRQESAYGSAKHQALAIGDQVLFLSPDRRKVRALSFSLEGGGWFAKDITFTAEHLTAPKVVDMAFARDPFNTLALCLTDGTLACCNYDRAEQLAGWWTVTPSQAVVQSVSVMNTENGDEVWCAGLLGSSEFLLRLPMYEAEEPLLDFQRTAVPASAQGVPVYGTMTYNSGTGVLTCTQKRFNPDTASTYYGLGVPGVLITVAGAEGTAVLRVVQALTEFTAEVEWVSGYAGSISAGATWTTSSLVVPWGEFAPVTGFGRDYNRMTTEPTAGVLNSAGVLTQMSTDGYFVLVPADEVYTVGFSYTATAETLPLEGGNPAGSAQGFKAHRAEIALRLSDSALPQVNGNDVSPARKIGDPLPTRETRVTADATAQNLGYEEGGIVTITQALPVRTEICAIYGSTRMVSR